MNITTNDSDFERHNFFVNLVRISLLWFLGILPSRISHWIFIKWSEDARRASHWARTYRALEIMYTFEERRRRKEVSFGDIFWETILSNARAIRNRIKFVKIILQKLIVEVASKNNSVKVLSLGSGSGRPLLETIRFLNGSIPTKCFFMDRSKSALIFGQELAKEILREKNDDNLRWSRVKVEDNHLLEQALKECSPDIIEMVGLLDYFDDIDARELFKLIFHHISPNGFFVVSNIKPNIERRFVTKAIKWPLIYRTSEELKQLLIDAGFNKQRIQIIVEPLGIYSIAICQKT